MARMRHGWLLDEPLTPLVLGTPPAGPDGDGAAWCDLLLDVRINPSDEVPARLGPVAAGMTVAEAGWRVETHVVPRHPGQPQRRADTYLVISAPDGFRFGIAATAPPNKTGPKVAVGELDTWLGPTPWWTPEGMDADAFRVVESTDRFDGPSLPCLFRALRDPDRWWGDAGTAQAHANVRGWMFLFHWSLVGVERWPDIAGWFPCSPADKPKGMYAWELPRPEWAARVFALAPAWTRQTVQHWLEVYRSVEDAGFPSDTWCVEHWIPTGFTAEEACGWDQMWTRFARHDGAFYPVPIIEDTDRYRAAGWTAEQVWEAASLLAQQSDAAQTRLGEPEPRTSHPAQFRDALWDWVEAMPGEEAVALLREQTSLAQWEADRHVEDLRAARRCVFPLTDIGARWSGRVRWSPPSSTWNDDDCWYLPADGTDDSADGVSFWDPEDDFGLEYGGTRFPSPCGAEVVGETGLCDIHAGLPHQNMNAKAWERVIEAIDYRLRAREKADDAWRAVRGAHRQFWQ